MVSFLGERDVSRDIIINDPPDIDFAYRKAGMVPFYSATDELIPSGLIDPVKLYCTKIISTDEYDMAIFEEDGEHYIIFVVWDYYIAGAM